MTKEKVYDIKQAKEMIDSLSNLFECVRIVDPKNTSVVNILDDQLHYDKKTCFKVWKKLNRCENCVSIKGLLNNSKQTKYETDQQEYYYVISKPIRIETDSQTKDLMVEIVNKVDDIMLSDQVNAENLVEMIMNAYEKAYKDYLTDAYNRRYLEEFLFIYNNKMELSKELGFIFMDLQKFKNINDNHGHHVGDKVLIQVVELIKKSIREGDSVVRLGGDEFLIIISNGAESQIPKVIERIKERIAIIEIDQTTKLNINADFGSLYIKDFEPNKTELLKIIQQVDMLMYKNKNSN